MNNIKTLLLNTPAEEIIEPYDKPDYPHIGLGYIAAFLRQMNNSVSVIDAKLENISISDALDRLNTVKPDVVGLTAYTQEIEHTASIAKEIKKRNPNITTVIGGVHASVLPRETLSEFKSFDFAISGEGEFPLNELIETLKNGGQLNKVKNLSYRNGNKICSNERRELNVQLDDLPFPAWDLFPPASTYPIITSRGCPFKCAFCTRPYGNRVRGRSPENVVSEFRDLVNLYGANNIVFRDETFAVNRNRAMKIADLIIEEKLNDYAKWNMHSRVDTVDYELLRKLKNAGCTGVGFGVESGNEKILKGSQKGITLKQVQNAVETAKNVGLRTSSYYILGLPNETKKTAFDTINFARKLKTDSISIAIMIPFPGTKIAEMVEKEEGGYKQISYKWSDYNKQTGAVVELKGLSRRQLVFFQLAGYSLFCIANFRFGFLYGTLKGRFRQVLVLLRNIFRR